MTQVAKVEKLLGREYAEISVARKTACGHDCENCGGCGVSGGQLVYAVAKNHIHACPGDQVVVESSTKNVMGAVAVVCLGSGTPPFRRRNEWCDRSSVLCTGADPRSSL